MIILLMLMLINVYISEMFFSIWTLLNVDCVLCIMYALLHVCFADVIYCSFFPLTCPFVVFSGRARNVV